MTQLKESIVYAERHANELGHFLIWDTVGDRMASGRCKRCGATLSLALSREGLRESTGRALHQWCGVPRGTAR